MSAPDGEMAIGQLAAHFGLATHVLRHWEAVGLLAPASRVSGRRRYRREHVLRVAAILIGKEAGLSLEDLREVLGTTPANRRDILERHHAALKRRMAGMQAATDLVEHALDCSSGDFTRCPTFQQIVETVSAPNRAETVSDRRHSPSRVISAHRASHRVLGSPKPRAPEA